MIPLRLRNQSEYDSGKAQNQYSPFRTTVFSPRDDGELDRCNSRHEAQCVVVMQLTCAWRMCAYGCLYWIDNEASRGPGSLFRDEWNSMAVNTQRKAVLLYR